MSEVRPVVPVADAPDPSLEPWVVRHRMLVLLVLSAVVFVGFLGLRDLWYPDEPNIAEVCRAMYLSGDWVAPRRNGEIWIDYPPLLYWTGCISSHLLGEMSAFSLRLPSALAAIALVLATCAAASRWFGARSGLWAGLFLLTFTQLVYNAVAYRPDMLFAVFIGCGTLAYVAGAGERPRWWLRVLGFALFGLAVLAKGPLGLLLPGLVLTLWLVGRRSWRRLLELAPLTLVALAVALPWYIACAHAMGAKEMWHDIHMQNFRRFDSGVGYQGHIRPVYYYLRNIWADLFPWVLLLPFALVWVLRADRDLRRRALFPLLWFGVWFVFLSLAATKRQLYLLPAYPAVALLLAPYVASLTRGGASMDPGPARVLTKAMALLLGVVGLGAVIGGIGVDLIVDRLELSPLKEEVAYGLRLPVIVTGGVALALGVWIWRARRRRSVGQAMTRLAVALVVVWILLLGAVFPALDPARTHAPASRWIRAEIGDEDRIGMVYPERGRNRLGAFVYYTGAYVDVLETEEDVERFFAAHPGSVVLLYGKAAEGFFAAATADWRARVVHEFEADQQRYLVLRPK